MSKQTRRPFPSQAKYSATKILELIHADLCGSISPETTAGNKYFLLLVDDYSRIMWVYLLKCKDEALGAFKKFRVVVENKSDKKVKTLRRDRGGEFTSNEFKAYCEDVGIERHYRAPYKPQQNGVVERRNMTIIEMARSYLKQMQLPSTLWGEAVRHSVYILNRLSTRPLTGITPYTAWTEKKHEVDHLHVFGCLSHMKIPNVQTKKLDDRSKPVINLGKEPGTKAYRLYDPGSNRVHVSKDVSFKENKTWPWKS